MLEDEKSRAVDRSVKTIKDYCNLLEIPGFKSDTLKQSPAFRAFVLSSFESTLKLVETNFTVSHPMGLSNVSDIIKYKLNNLPPVFPEDNCLNLKRPQRPQFRKVNINFFKSVISNLNTAYAIANFQVSKPEFQKHGWY